MQPTLGRLWRGTGLLFVLLAVFAGAAVVVARSAAPFTPGAATQAAQAAPATTAAEDPLQTDPEADPSALPKVTEGSLVYRSPISGRYDYVPLRHTDVEIDVRGLVASATVKQLYANETDQPIEAVYVFPLPHDAAVYDMEIRIGARRIRSLIQERAEARRSYEQAKAEGRRAGLLEQERPNIFTMSVANVMPGDEIEVRLRYVEPLQWEDGRMRLTFPMVVGPRYIPSGVAQGSTGTGWAPDTDRVPDASRITPQVSHPLSRSGHDISLRVRADLGVELAEATSPSHPVIARPRERGGQELRLAEATTLPNRDFVLELRRADATAPKTALFLSQAPGSDETHFMLVAFPPSADPEGERSPLDLVFVIDVSGSMEGASIEQAREALLQGLSRLRPGDRFNVIAFESRFTALSPSSVVADSAHLEAGRAFVSALRANGGTEMLPALQYTMATPREPGLTRQIVLLTDGCLGNESEILTALEQRLGDARLFTVAIGSAPNHYLATKMADLGRGSFTAITDGGEVGAQMGRLLDKIESPVLSDLAVSVEGAVALDLYPSRPGDLFLREPLVVMGRIQGEARGRLRLTGRGRNAPFEAAFELDPADAAFHPGVTTLWARQRIGEAMDEWRRAQSEEDKAKLRARVIEDAIRYRLVTRFTSLVAVEDVIANTSGELPLTAAVPTALPHGWQMEKVFGANPATGTADRFLETLGLALLLLGAALRLRLRPAEARS
jgi:Ca-activated chloride channel homolog